MERVISGTFTGGDFAVNLVFTGDGVDEDFGRKADLIMGEVARDIYCNLLPSVNLVVAQQRRLAGAVTADPVVINDVTVTADPVVINDVTVTADVTVNLSVDVPVDLDEVIRANVINNIANSVDSVLGVFSSVGSLIGNLIAALGGGGDSDDDLGGIQILDLGALMGGGIFGASSDDLCPDCGTNHSDAAASLAGLFSRRSSVVSADLVSADQGTDVPSATS